MPHSAAMGDPVPQPDGTDERNDAAPDAHPLLPLVARELRLDINGRAIIREVSFRVMSPGRTVILGPNGAGKSMLLRVITSYSIHYTKLYEYLLAQQRRIAEVQYQVEARLGQHRHA